MRPNETPVSAYAAIASVVTIVRLLSAAELLRSELSYRFNLHSLATAGGIDGSLSHGHAMGCCCKTVGLETDDERFYHCQAEGLKHYSPGEGITV